MKFGVLGTGGVGQTLGSKLVELGHEVKMGSRQAGNENAVAWAAQAGDRGGEGSFQDAAQFGETLINATAGTVSVDVLRAAGAGNLAGKVVVDASNPLDFSGGMPPILSVCNDDSVGERIQREFPDARVVKALNTVSSVVMVDPSEVGESHTLFICGDDEQAKRQVADLLESFGWPRDDVLDLGDISCARGVEMYLPLWLRMMGALGGVQFNVKVVAG